MKEDSAPQATRDQRRQGEAAHQLEPEVRHSTLGNAATLIAFRTGVEDAAPLAKEFAPVFAVNDLINLPNRGFYARLMIGGAPSKAFSAELLPLKRQDAVAIPQ